MRKQSYTEVVNEAKLMLHGLGQNLNTMGKRGINEAFMAEFTELHQQAQALDSEQESLKAKLKQKTEALESVVEKLGGKLSESRKLVKMDIPQSGWKEFGIQDVR